MKRNILLALVLLGAALGLSAKTPVIGISAYSESGQCRVNMTYVNSVRMAGGVPLVIPVTGDMDQIDAVLEAVDGILGDKVKPGDVVAVCQKSQASAKFKALLEEYGKKTVPAWIEKTADAFEGKIAALPSREDIDYEVSENLIVELYSR